MTSLEARISFFFWDGGSSNGASKWRADAWWLWRPTPWSYVSCFRLSFFFLSSFLFLGWGTCTHWHVITLMGNVTSDQYMCECCHLQRETDICVNAVFCNAFPSICSVFYIYIYRHTHTLLRCLSVSLSYISMQW